MSLRGYIIKLIKSELEEMLLPEDTERKFVEMKRECEEALAIAEEIKGKYGLDLVALDYNWTTFDVYIYEEYEPDGAEIVWRAQNIAEKNWGSAQSFQLFFDKRRSYTGRGDAHGRADFGVLTVAKSVTEDEKIIPVAPAIIVSGGTISQDKVFLPNRDNIFKALVYTQMLNYVAKEKDIADAIFGEVPGYFWRPRVEFNPDTGEVIFYLPRMINPMRDEFVEVARAVISPSMKPEELRGILEEIRGKVSAEGIRRRLRAIETYRVLRKEDVAIAKIGELERELGAPDPDYTEITSRLKSVFLGGRKTERLYENRLSGTTPTEQALMEALSAVAEFRHELREVTRKLNEIARKLGLHPDDIRLEEPETRK